MHVRQSHEMIDCQWCWAEFEERSGVGRNRTVVNAVIPLHQSNGDRQRDTKAPCGCDKRKQARQVETGFFPQPVTSAGPGANEWRGRTCERVSDLAAMSSVGGIPISVVSFDTSGLVWDSRENQYGNGRTVNVQVSRTSRGLCGSCNLISAHFQP